MDIRRTARLLALCFLGLGASAARAAADGSQLALPPGATVAIVVFEDLQCPDCARAHPGLLAASKEHSIPSYYIAAIHLGLRDHDHAFEWFDRACQERCSLLGTLKVDPVFDPLRADPRFAALMRCVRLAD